MIALAKRQKLSITAHPVSWQVLVLDVVLLSLGTASLYIRGLLDNDIICGIRRHDIRMVRHSISIDQEVVLVVRDHRGPSLVACWHVESVAGIHRYLPKAQQTLIILALGLGHNSAVFNLVDVRGLNRVISIHREPIVELHHPAEAALRCHWHLVSNGDHAGSHRLLVQA